MVIITTFISAADLKKAIRKQAEKAMNDVSKKGLRAAEKNVRGFYTGSPVVYQRTGALRDSPDTTGVSVSGSVISTEIFLDDTYSYHTGTWTVPQIMSVAETGSGNLVGSPGFWRRTLDDMPGIIKESFHENGFE